MDPRARRVIESLRLEPHPEGGFYRETFRSPTQIRTVAHGRRHASTSIYYLLPKGGLAALHRVRSDEIWHHYDGDPIELHLLVDEGDGEIGHEIVRLGSRVSAGECPQAIVRAGTWQAARAVSPAAKKASTKSAGRSAGYALAGCTVAPGFEHTDFEMPSRERLLRVFPGHRELVEKLTHAPPTKARG